MPSCSYNDYDKALLIEPADINRRKRVMCKTDQILDDLVLIF